VPVSREAQLNRAFVELADTLVNHFDVVDLLHTLSSHCVELFDVDAAGLLLADAKGALRVIASSTEQTRMLELLEVQSEEGPCLDCFYSGQTVIEEDLETAGRWPTFTQAATAAGFGAVEALPLRLRESIIGALNLFHRQTGRLDEADLQACQALADVATISLLQERAVREARLLADQLQIALNNRVLIEQAKGVLAERAGVDMDAAFQLLRGHARSNNLPVAEVAQAIIDGRLAAADLQSAKR
jgi:transcriptional regulator with GAF, ATPase, and Fis domain